MAHHRLAVYLPRLTAKSVSVAMTARINLLALQHSQGLLLDAAILNHVLSCVPVDVVESRIGRPQATVAQLLSELGSIVYHRLCRFDVNIHIEDIKPRWIDCARFNWWIPNQEWVRFPIESVRHRTDLVLCKTHVAEQIFRTQGFPTQFIGFTTADRIRTLVPRVRRVLHVAGQSPNKGTTAVIAAWKAHPDWPMLDLVWKAPPEAKSILPSNVELHRSPISDDDLATLQNRCLFHLCPSAVEGFGHTIVEAMSCGAIVITTDAPPMHELVEQDRGILVPWDRSEAHGLGTAYHVGASHLSAGIEAALRLSSNELHAKSARARAWFAANDLNFRDRLASVVAERCERA